MNNALPEIKDFVSYAPVEPEIIEAYRGRVPDALIELWEKYGYGSFAEGFIRVINPKKYEEQVGDCIGKTQGDGVAIPVMVTGLGDLITWEPSVGSGALVAIKYRREDTSGLGSVRTFITLVKAGGARHLSRTLEWDIFPEAVAAYGELPYDQSFIFVPLLSLGGQPEVTSLQKRDTIAAIQVAVEMQGVVGH